VSGERHVSRFPCFCSDASHFDILTEVCHQSLLTVPLKNLIVRENNRYDRESLRNVEVLIGLIAGFIGDFGVVIWKSINGNRYFIFSIALYCHK
jgi:hypothetical protein